jgi:predicted adenylyl cyclase CyaB
MASNVEIKARLRDPAVTADRARALAGAGPTLIEQHDTFYRAARGRLKLRRFPGGGGELIWYDRPDSTGPKTSDYRLYRTDDTAALDAVLAGGLEPVGDVRKRRLLYLVGRTRVHLDEVAGLGDFLELEVVLAEGEDAAAGRAEADRLLDALGVAPGDLVAGAYQDLLAARK